MPPTDRRIARLQLRTKKFYYPQTCDIQQQDSWTGPTHGTATWTTLYQDVPCRLMLQRQFSRNEVVDLAGVEIIGELYTIALPPEYILPTNCRVLIDSKYYDVVNIKQRLTDKVFNLYIITRQEGI
jgi:hypothetical protein